MTVTIDFSELEDVARLLRADEAKVSVVVHAATIAIGGQVKARAKAAAPTDRPWLSTEGIFVKTRKDERGSHSDIFTVPDPEGRPTGIFVEYGTSTMAPQPFLAIQSAWAETAYPAAIGAKLDPLR